MTHGQVHGLVNNAGGQYPSPLASINQKGFETVLRTNLVGGFLMAREVFNQSHEQTRWRHRQYARRHVGRHAGHGPLRRRALPAWTTSPRPRPSSGATPGCGVNAVAPGWIASSGMDTYEGAFKAVIPTLREHVPLKRIGTESEVSAAIVFLLSPGGGVHQWQHPAHRRRRQPRQPCMADAQGEPQRSRTTAFTGVLARRAQG